MLLRKRKSRWVLEPEDVPSELAVRLMPELAGQEENVWLRLLTASFLEAAWFPSLRSMVIGFLIATTAAILTTDSLIWFLDLLDAYDLERINLRIAWLAMAGGAGLAAAFLIVPFMTGVSGTLMLLFRPWKRNADPFKDLQQVNQDPRDLALGILSRHVNSIPVDALRRFMILLVPLVAGAMAIESQLGAKHPVGGALLAFCALVGGHALGALRAYPQIKLHRLVHAAELVWESSPRKERVWLICLRVACRDLASVAFLILTILALLLSASILDRLYGIELAPWLFERRPGFYMEVIIFGAVCGTAGWLWGLQKAWIARKHVDYNLQLLGAASVGVIRTGLENPEPSELESLRSARKTIQALRKRFWPPKVTFAAILLARFLMLGIPAGFVLIHFLALNSPWAVGVTTALHAVITEGRSITEAAVVGKWAGRGDQIVGWTQAETRQDLLRIVSLSGDLGILDDSQSMLKSADKFELSLEVVPDMGTKPVAILAHPQVREKLATLALSAPSFNPVFLLAPLDLHAARQPLILRLTYLNLLQPLTLGNHLDRLEIFACSNLFNLKSAKNGTRIETVHIMGIFEPEMPDFTDAGRVEVNELHVTSCKNLRELSAIWQHIGLKKLDLKDLDSLMDLDGCESLTALEEIELESLPLISSLDPLKHCQNLRSIFISDLPSLVAESLLSLEPLEKVEHIRFGRVTPISPPSNPSPPALTRSSLRERHNLIHEEAAYIEAQVRWPRALEAAVEELKTDPTFNMRARINMRGRFN